MVLVYFIKYYLGYFLLLNLFSIIAIITAKRNYSWICLTIGAIAQLLILVYNQIVLDGVVIEDWITYFCIIIIASAFVTERRKRHISKNQEERTNYNTTKFESKFNDDCLDEISFCSKCGANIKKDIHVCHVCGEKINMN